MKIERIHWMGMIVGLAVVLASFIFFYSSNPSLTYFLSVVGLLVGIFPFVMGILLNQSVQKEKEEMFLSFTRDLVENVKSGTPISKGIINLRNRNYGALSPHVFKLANQLSLGITLSESLATFAKETKSPVISRAVTLISEAERAGGKIETIVESVAASVNQTDKLKKERKAAVSNLVTQGYIIFIVFIIIMLVLEYKILPLVSDLSSAEGLGVDVKKIDPDEFAKPLFYMILVQSFFTGLVVGKISEGTLWAGVKHSFILVAITLLVVTGAAVLFQ